MNKKLYLLSALFCLAFIAFTSCSDDDNDGIDYVWKARNEKLFKDAEADYPRTLDSFSKNGYVRYKTTSGEFEDNTYVNDNPTIGYPSFTDSVTCRYKGWYINADGKEVVFDSTEDEYNKQQGVTFIVSGVIDGWATMLQTMEEGDETEVCIPYILAYGASGSGSIPAYTTLFFKMKLLKIKRN